MNATDQKKLCLAGYTILRPGNHPKPHIKFKSVANPDHWKKYGDGDYPSKALRDMNMNILLKDDKIIQDP